MAREGATGGAQRRCEGGGSGEERYTRCAVVGGARAVRHGEKTPPSDVGQRVAQVLGKLGGVKRRQKPAAGLDRVARPGAFTQKIIGHEIVRAGCRGSAVGGRPGMQRLAHRAVALFDQPAGQERARVLLEPLVQQAADLLAQVGGVVQPGQLVGVQGERGGGEKELPGGWVLYVLKGPPEGKRLYSSILVILVKDNYGVRSCGNLWKTRKNPPICRLGRLGPRAAPAPGITRIPTGRRRMRTETPKTSACEVQDLKVR